MLKIIIGLLILLMSFLLASLESPGDKEEDAWLESQKIKKLK